MQTTNPRFHFTFFTVAFLATSTFSFTFECKNVQAQEAASAVDAKAMIEASLKVLKTEYQPLSEKSSRTYMGFSRKVSAEKSIIRNLEERTDKSLASLKQNIEHYQRELEVCQRSAAAIEALESDPESIEKVTKHCNGQIEIIEIEKKKASKVINDEQQALRKKYADDDKEFRSVMLMLTKEKGASELTKDLVRKENVYASFSQASVSGYYAKDSDTDLSLTIYFHQSSEAREKYGKFLDKYPVVSKRNRSVIFHVGNCQINLSGRNDKWTEENLAAAAKELIDLDALEQANPAG